MPRKKPLPFLPVVPANTPSADDPPVTWGYARVSTDEQVTDSQDLALRTAGVDPARIVTERVGGGIPAASRPLLAGVLSVLRSGDSLTTVRLDRLGRDPADVLTLTRDLSARDVRVRFLDLGAETGTPAGDLIIGVLASVAGWERATLRARTREGLAAARARGQDLGRRRTLTRAQRDHAAELAEQGRSVRAIARALGCTRSVAHRAVSEKLTRGPNPRSWGAAYVWTRRTLAAPGLPPAPP